MNSISTAYNTSLYVVKCNEYCHAYIVTVCTVGKVGGTFYRSLFSSRYIVTFINEFRFINYNIKIITQCHTN